MTDLVPASVPMQGVEASRKNHVASLPAGSFHLQPDILYEHVSFEPETQFFCTGLGGLLKPGVQFSRE